MTQRQEESLERVGTENWQKVIFAMALNFDNVTFQGPALADAALLAALPDEYSQLLTLCNGFIAFAGGLHIRGLCADPDWHSLQKVWTGDLRLATLYPSLESSDILFGQDCVGDQFILREGIVYRLWAETGDMETLGCGFNEFFLNAATDPLEYLSLQPLLQFQREGGMLSPGKLLNVYPPFCTKEAAAGVSLRAISALERISFLADFAGQI